MKAEAFSEVEVSAGAAFNRYTKWVSGRINLFFESGG